MKIDRVSASLWRRPSAEASPSGRRAVASADKPEAVTPTRASSFRFTSFLDTSPDNDDSHLHIFESPDNNKKADGDVCRVPELRDPMSSSFAYSVVYVG